MKKIFILLTSIIFISAASICSASWWHDFTHSEYEDYGPKPCWSCGGSGVCSFCGGGSFAEENAPPVMCESCGGSGKCSACGGSGYGYY